MGYSAKLTEFFATTRRISLGLGVLKSIRALLSVYSVMLSAKYFGISLERDTWVLAVSAVTVLTQLMFGPINEIFRAKFIHIKAEEGEEKALKSISSLIYTIIGLSLLIIALVEVFPGLLSGLFAPGFNGAEQESLSQMIRWMIPSLLLNEIIMIWIAVLNVYRSYFIPDIYSLITIVINVVCVIVLAPFIGIYSLIVSYYIGSGILAMILVFILMKAEKNILAWSCPQWDLIKPFVVTSSPFYFAFIAGNVQMAIERILSTYLGVGNVSVLDYARRFINMPMSVIAGVLTTVLTPILAELFIRDKHEDFYREIIKFMRMLILWLIPFVLLVSVCSRELVELLLVHGSFKKESVDVTALSLTLYCLGAVGYSIFAVGGQAAIAQKRTSLIAIVCSVTAIVSTAMYLSLFKVVGLVAFPFSWGLTLFMSGLYMVYCQYSNRVETFKEIGKMLSLLLLVTAVSFVVRLVSIQVLYKTVTDIKRHDILIVLTTALIGNLFYFSVLYLFNLEELQGIKRYIAEKFKRFSNRTIAVQNR